MKKKLIFKQFPPIRRKEIFLKMKITTILCLVFAMHLSANVFSQNEKISIKMENATIEKVLAKASKITNLNFFYSTDKIDVKEEVDVNIKNKTVKEFLQNIFKSQNVSFKFSNNFVVISRNVTEPDNVQKLQIKGNVKDKDGKPLPGVTVRIKGTIIGVSTNAKGYFSLTIDKRDNIILIFSFIGMKSQELIYKGQKEINITLIDDTQELDDVVITGYANVSRESFTGNVKTISAEEIKKIAPTNILTTLQVLDPSFRLDENNIMGSDPNTVPNIRLRGSSSLETQNLNPDDITESALQNNPNLPTFIMDGFEISVEKLFDMDVNRISQITILKDAAATAIYGSRAANGVVIITTVAPKPGEVTVSYNYSLNLEFPDLSDYNLMNSKEKLEAEKAAGIFDGFLIQDYYAKTLLLEKGYETDWISLPLRNAQNSRHYARIEGGTTNIRYSLDASIYGENGVMKGSKRNRQSFNFDLQYNTAALIFKNSASYMGVNSSNSPYGSFAQYTYLNPYIPCYDDRGLEYSTIYINTTQTGANPIYEAKLGGYDRTNSKSFTDNFNMRYYIKPEFYIKANLSLSYTSTENNKYKPYGLYEFKHRDNKGSFSTLNSKSTTIDGGLHAYYNNY